ncbi:MAG: hypothetical protein DRG30_08020 [Epsilonproteobacteria bacterium]|nr:MAG: hypothetical protein DRG30_08020 [Campylobacterota bacterium]
MLSINQILKFAKTDKLNRHILQEYFQYEILDSLFKQDDSLNYSFLGGTAIRLIYGGMRYSEDLDFDTTNLDVFDELLSTVVKSMQDKGFEIEFRLIHKGAYHCHIKFPSVLHSYGLSGYKEEKLFIKVDATTTDKLYTSSHALDNYGVFRKIQVAPAPVLLSQKLYTIGARKRPKGRDLYDVTWLWGMGSPDEKYTQDVLGKSVKELIIDTQKYLTTIDLDDLIRDTKPFLINPDDIRRIKFFPQYLSEKLQEL